MLDFPDAPTIDQVFTSPEGDYKWNGYGWGKVPPASATGAYLPLAGGLMTGGINWAVGTFSATDYSSQLRLNKDPTYQMGISATTNGMLNYMVENTGNRHSFQIGGVEKFQINNGGCAGLKFGSHTAGAASDLSRHVDLFGGTMGINITSGRINYFIAAGQTRHSFLQGGVEHFFIDSTGGHAASMLFAADGFYDETPSRIAALKADPELAGLVQTDQGDSADCEGYNVGALLFLALAKIKKLEEKMKIITDLT